MVPTTREKSLLHVALGGAFSLAMLAFAYLWAGWLIAVVFATGFVVGYVVWLVRPQRATVR